MRKFLSLFLQHLWLFFSALATVEVPMTQYLFLATFQLQVRHLATKLLAGLRFIGVLWEPLLLVETSMSLGLHLPMC